MTAVRHYTVKGAVKKKIKNLRGAFASGAAFPGSPWRKTAASEREEKRNKPRKTEGRRNKTGAQLEGREHTDEEVSDVVCENFSLEYRELLPLQFSSNWNCVETWISFHVLLDDALLWHPRGPLCCKQVMKVGERRLWGCRKGIYGSQHVFFWVYCQILWYRWWPLNESSRTVRKMRRLFVKTTAMERCRERPAVDQRFS